MVLAGEVGFLLREKLAEFTYGLGFAKLFSGEKDLAKPRLNSLEFSRPQKGVWGMSAGGFPSDFQNDGKVL